MTTTEAPTSIAPLPQRPPVELVRLSMDTLAGFEALQRAARLLAASTLVPEQYRGEKGLANCVIAMEMATRIGASPLMVMQNLYVVHGRPGWASQFLIAAVNSSGRFTALGYEWKGEPFTPEWGCRAWATERSTGERKEGTWITWAMVKAEGWSKAGSKWLTMPEQMFVYRAAGFWTRAYAPEVAMGLQSKEEVDDAWAGPSQPDTIDLNSALAADRSATAAAADVLAQPESRRGPEAVRAAVRRNRRETEPEASLEESPPAPDPEPEPAGDSP